MQDTIWICRDGRRIRVSSMSTRHIHNCIRMIKRGGPTRLRLPGHSRGWIRVVGSWFLDLGSGFGDEGKGIGVVFRLSK